MSYHILKELLNTSNATQNNHMGMRNVQFKQLLQRTKPKITIQIDLQTKTPRL